MLWLIAGASAVYWGLKFVKGPAAPASASMAVPGAAPAGVDSLALAKGLGGGLAAANSGATSSAPAAQSSLNASRFVLTGVVLSRNGSTQSSVALIGFDGKPARPYRVGAKLASDVVLHSVAAGKAMLATDAQSPAALTLELPKSTTALVGTATPLRPVIAAAPAVIAAPAAAPAPPPGPTPSALSALGNRPLRPGANRPREAGKEEPAATEQAPAPAPAPAQQ